MLCIVTVMANDFAFSLLFFTIGFYFPVFYLQLDAVKHGVNQKFAFYLVCVTVSRVKGTLINSDIISLLYSMCHHSLDVYPLDFFLLAQV